MKVLVLMENLTEVDVTYANALWISTGILGCALNTALFIVVLLNSAKGFYRALTLVIALVDFSCAFSGIFSATSFYKIDNVMYCVDHGLSNNFPEWLINVNTAAWMATFYGELVIITYTFIWRAVLISNSRHVRFFENKLVFVLFFLDASGIGYLDYTGDGCAEHIDLTPLESFRIVLPATLTGLHFIVIAGCALFIYCKIKSGTLSKTTRNTHKKSLLVLSIQALNPFFLNFLIILTFEVASVAPIPEFFVSFIPYSSLHPILNPLIILALTSDHRNFLLKLCSQHRSSSSVMIFKRRNEANLST